MSKSSLAISILTILLGISMFIFGGADDSPGAQLLGALAVIAGIIIFIKNKKKSDHK